MSLAPVSVIIPCYCCMDTITKAVESVADQTLRPKELILVDDGSPDQTSEILLALQRKYSSDWLKVFILDKNHGVSHARNFGWDKATQHYIAFLDGDDLWHKQKIAIQYSWMNAHPEIDGSGHNYTLIQSDKLMPLVTFRDDRFTAYPLAYKALLLSNPLTPSTVMLKKKISLRFSPGKKYCEDYLLWLQLLSEGYALVMLKPTLLFKGTGKQSASKNLVKMRLSDLENYKILWKSGKLSFFKMIFYASISFLKFCFLLILGPKAQLAIRQFFEKRFLVKRNPFLSSFSLI